MKKISVIVPIYNVEFDLKEALNSLLNQTIIDDIEVIMVDDGSSDYSKYIIDEYADAFDNFYAFHKENDGPSSARNYGLKHAKGEYVHFFDSDDLIAYNAYEKLYEYAQKDKYDVITGNFLKFNYEKTWANVIGKFVFKNLKEDIPDTTLLKTPELTWDMFIWNKLIRREFLEENNIRFPKEKINYGEDNVFSIEVYDKAKKIAVTKDFVYFWRERASGTSITQDYSRKRANDTINIFHIVKKYLDNHVSKKEILEKKYLKWLTWDIPLFIELFKKFPEDEYDNLIQDTNEILDLVPTEFFNSINTYHTVLYDIVRDKDLDNLLRFLSIDYKKNPVIPEDLEEKYKEKLNFIEDAKGEELDTYASSISKNDNEIIININNHIPFIESKESDEVYGKLVNPNFDDLILDAEYFKENELHIPLELINPGENVLYIHYTAGEVGKEHYVLTNTRKSYSFKDFDINIARGMTSYLRLIKREKNNTELLIDEINILNDKIEFKGTSNESLNSVTINDILDLTKLSFSVAECNKNSEGTFDVSIDIDYNEFLKAPVKKWELEIDGLYNKVNVDRKYYFADELYSIEVKNYENKVFIEFARHDPATKIAKLNKKNEKLEKGNNELVGHSKDYALLNVFKGIGMKRKAKKSDKKDKNSSKEELEEEDPKKVEEKRILAMNSEIYSNYYGDIDENLVYLESRDGEDFTGNILRIAEELSKEQYNDLKVCVYAKEKITKEIIKDRKTDEETIIIHKEEPVKEKILELMKNYDLKIDEIVSNEDDATKVLEKSKYIITDSGLRPRYVKRDNQIVLYTAHGTPFKRMGVDNITEEHTIGSVQHPMLSADYLLYPNEYMQDKMLNAYMLEKIYPGTILKEGYPRNCVFFNDERRKEIKNKFELNNKEIFLYLPTVKGTYFERLDEEHDERLKNYFIELDKKLNDNQVFIVKIHHLNETEIDYSEFKHIKPFPKGYETYDIVNLANVLVTDYSSVFFDFVNTKRKIILFNYDEEEYMRYRGTYFPLSDLPFPRVQTVDELVKELNSPKEYDDSAFIEKFCTYDNPNAIENICKHIFKGEKVCKEEKIKGNGKPNLLIFAGGLLNNGIASSFVNMINAIDRTKYNVYLSYRQKEWSIRKYHEHIFNLVPDDVEFLALRSNVNLTAEEYAIYQEFIDDEDENAKYPKYLDKMFKRELNRYYPNLKFDKFIHFDGYGRNSLLLFKNLDCERSVWVHTDMVQEIETKRNQHIGILKEVYGECDNVIVVSPELIESTSNFVDKDKIKVVHNVYDNKEILTKADKEINIDKFTRIITHNVRSIKGVLESPGYKFITIGKFKGEKGHIRLIKAFEEFSKDYPDSQLIIIGGHGNYLERIKNLRDESDYWKNITLIHWIANPMPILKQCDCFVLSSFYEGWPMTLIEADVLKVPIIATDVVGTQWVKEYGGHLVEDSEEGILQGFYDFVEGKINPLTIDWEKYNEEAIKEINSILY